jgi:hypothetical protein
MTVDAFIDGIASPARALGAPLRQTRNESV